MKRIALLAALALAGSLMGSASAQDKPKPSPAEAPKSDAPKPMADAAKKPHTVKHTPKRQEDARRCLDETSNDAIIKCAEEYL